MAAPSNKQFVPVPLDAVETSANKFFTRNYAKTDDLKFIGSLTRGNSPAGLIEYLNSMHSILCEHIGVSSFFEHFTGYRCEFMTISRHDLYELTDGDRYTPIMDKRSGHLKVMERVAMKSVMTVPDIQTYVACISQIAQRVKATPQSFSSPVIANATTATVMHGKDVNRDRVGSGVADDVRAALAAADSANQRMDAMPTLESGTDTKYRPVSAPASVATLFGQDQSPVAMAAAAAAAAATVAGCSQMTGVSLNEHHKTATSSIASFSALVQPLVQVKPDPQSTSKASNAYVGTVASSQRPRHDDDTAQLAAVMDAFHRLKVNTKAKSETVATGQATAVQRAYLNYEVRESKQMYREVMANYEGPFPHDSDVAHSQIAELYCHTRIGVSAKAHEVRPTTGRVPVFVHRKRNGTRVPFVLFSDFQVMLNGASVSQSANGKMDVTAIGTCYHARVNAGGRFQPVVALLPQALGLLKNGDLANQYQEQLYCILGGQTRDIDGAPMRDASSLRSD